VVTYGREGLQSRMTLPMAAVRALACAGEEGVAGCEDGSLYRFELTTGRPLAAFEQGGAAIRALAIVGQRIVTFSDEGCRAWSPDLVPSISYTQAPATAGAADQRVVCVGRSDGSIEVYPLEGGPARLRLVGHQAPIASLALSPDGKRLYSSANDTTVKIWRLD
jgi:WD40 repeat protein